jgi:hypothetical protein
VRTDCEGPSWCQISTTLHIALQRMEGVRFDRWLRDPTSLHKIVHIHLIA